MQSALARIIVAAIGLANVASADPLTDVAAAVARASTPLRDRPAPASAVDSVNLRQMRAQAAAASLDCQAWQLQYEFSTRLLPDRGVLRDVFDALALDTKCGVSPPGPVESTVYVKPLAMAELAFTCTVGPYFVDAVQGNDSNAGSRESPFQSVLRAVRASREGRSAPGVGVPCIVLRGGVHFLNATVVLSAADSGLVVTGADGELAWVSGGVALGPLSWSPYRTAGSMNIWVADVPVDVPVEYMPGLNTVDDTAPPERLFRARYPNYDQEQFKGNLPGMKQIVAYEKPPIMPIPELYYLDLKAMGLKNDSTMREYNIYATGRGGPCNHWANDGSEWAYVCSNSTAGGWEEIERGFASTGQLGFPIGLAYNKSLLPSFANWTMPAHAPNDWRNVPTFTAWHNQGWYQGIFAVTALNTSSGSLTLSDDGVYPAGGWQGGRTFENCKPDNLDPKEPLCSGPWYVSNIFEELDAPGEYYYDATGRKLYIFYNATPGTSPPPSWRLSVPQLEVFINATGTPAAPVRDITLAGIAFRDQRTAQLDRWHDPSGGDWGLRRAGLIHLEGTERANITGSTFYRTDANAVFLAAYNRNASVVDCEFAYTGFSAVVTFGRTVQEDGTGGEQPWGTLIAYNKVHELGTFQLQSSAWFTSKSAATRFEGNVVFNIPRAAVNFNDAFGGGNNVSAASIFNTCRQSGDHGPLNSWDRMPFKTAFKTLGGVPSFDARLSDTHHSMVIANYGASQGFDNDDGSSWYNTYDNFFYDASGFKMDYGGHDSQFHDNVVVATNGQNCLGTAAFVRGHATRIFRNKCIVFGTERVDDLFENCDKPDADQEMVKGTNNTFYTKNANASATCDCCGLRPLSALPAGLEDGYASLLLPTDDQIIAWGREKLRL